MDYKVIYKTHKTTKRTMMCHLKANDVG